MKYQYVRENCLKTEEKKYGSMSAAVYRKERAHAETYPILDWTKIKIEPMSVDDFDKKFMW